MVLIGNSTCGGFINPIKSPIRTNDYLFNSKSNLFKTKSSSMNHIAKNFNSKLIHHNSLKNKEIMCCTTPAYPLQRAQFLKINKIFNKKTEGSSTQKSFIQKKKFEEKSTNFQIVRTFSTNSNIESKKKEKKLSTTDSSYFSSASTSSLNEIIDKSSKKCVKRLTHTQSWPLQIRNIGLIERRGFLRQTYELFKIVTFDHHNEFNIQAELFWLKSKIIQHWSMQWIFKLQVKTRYKKNFNCFKSLIFKFTIFKVLLFY